MVEGEVFLRFCDDALEQFAALCRELGDDLVNTRVEGVQGSNSAFVLVAHVCGVMGFWGRTTNRGLPVPRDRDAEFVAEGSVEEALDLIEDARRRLHDDVVAAVVSAPPVEPVRDDVTVRYATQGEVLLHVYEELAQHLGQLEVTRDVLLRDHRASDPGR
ncbi:DUF664 domain-containing protein [Phycicoccus endophyticus]|uniref:DUF664 domain-containing protein n=1 Tax=Phycicoccus endophyticus TaxID=1690220 RepID=A0A7G9QYF4_9MICO|nr:DUF664 domain-containing protein [Phycicoccus endophyticus]NHI19275.1 DUF664 domain-containing protein [Phycicoccus endophyticus]QNN48379.1 DUF664 domain-containing protein [Phycicoccus endophyticus]GGL41458.1 hypothetical protein GCM10012283_25090 [Phycicoccus endophyticus]